MIDKELIHQAAEDIDIFEADLTEEYERLCKQQIRKSKPSPIVIALRTVSTMAAVWLIGLFLYLHRPTNEVLPNNIAYKSCSNTLKEIYAHQKTRKQTLNYTQFKKMLYENK